MPGRRASVACWLRWPPGHRWKVVEDEDRYRTLLCERCGTSRRITPPYAGPPTPPSYGE